MEQERLFYEYQMRFKYDIIEEIDNTGIYVPSLTSPKQSPTQMDGETPATILDVDVTIRIPLSLSDNEVVIHDGPQVSVCKLLHLFQEKTMIIYNALLYEKRIVMVGHNKNAGEVASYVLSVCSLAPGIPQVLRKRVFPYVSLGNMDFLSITGYIVGATNPMFAREEYWDCMCDLDKGSIQVSSEMLLNQVRNQQMYNYPPNSLLQITGKRKGSLNNLIYHHRHEANSTTGPVVTSIMGKQDPIVVATKRKSLTSKPTVISGRKRSKTPTNQLSPSKTSPTEDDDREYVIIDSVTPSPNHKPRASSGYLDHSTGMLTFEYSNSYPDICYLTELDLHFVTKVSILLLYMLIYI
jgi:hypothetical protein